eukprot:COSAG02_NODE_14377_length_1278_cov_1.797286_2_plen_152_part_00
MWRRIGGAEMNWWYDNSDDSDGSSEAMAEWRQEFHAEAELRKQRLAAGGIGWVEQCSLAVRQCEQELRGSPFWASVQAALHSCRDSATPEPVELVCYGLGELDAPSARFQLGLLLLLATELRIQAGSVYTHPARFPQSRKFACLRQATLGN